MTDNNTNTENNIKDIKSIVDDAFNLFKSADIVNDGENTFRFFETLLNRYKTFTKNNYYIEYEDFKFNLLKVFACIQKFKTTCQNRQIFYSILQNRRNRQIALNSAKWKN